MFSQKLFCYLSARLKTSCFRSVFEVSMCSYVVFLIVWQSVFLEELWVWDPFWHHTKP